MSAEADLIACPACGLARQHTYNECAEIRIARAKLEEAKYWDTEPFDPTERIADLQAQLSRLTGGDVR